MATEVCTNILEEIRSSSLNFVISETPVSAYISLRKRFVKDVVQPSLPRQSDENEALKRQVTVVLARLKESEANCAAARDTIEILETKVQKVESKVLEIKKNSKAALDDKKAEIKVINGVIKNNSDETLRIQNENKKLTKGVKAHEKEIHNLENKNENQGQTIRNLKESLNCLKSEKRNMKKPLRKNQANQKLQILTLIVLRKILLNLPFFLIYVLTLDVSCLQDSTPSYPLLCCCVTRKAPLS